MLGEQLLDERGQITGQRVLPTDGHGSKVEISIETAGTLLGVATHGIATYVAFMRPDGTVYADGQGMVMTADGEGLTFKASGIGRLTGQGGATSIRGAAYWQTASEKLVTLNGTVGVFEYETDAEGNTHTVMWEWK